jgi:MSHA biogenesis protein MshP
MNKQTGFSLVGAIFILVIVSLLGQYLLGITGVQRQTSLLALQSARAYQAANAGIEWAVGHSLFCSSGNFMLNNFTITVTSVADNNNPYNEDDVNIEICYVTSKAEYGVYGQLDYVSRTIEANIQQ